MTEILSWLVAGSLVLGVGGAGCIALGLSFRDDYLQRKHNRQMARSTRKARA